MDFTGKRILLLAPDDYQLFKLVADNLTYLGFDVTTIVHNSVKFKYRSLGQRLLNLYRKVKDGNNQFKQKLKLEHVADTLIHQIEEEDDFDYCLVLRADFFHSTVLEVAKMKSRKIVAYHYDGLKRNPRIIDLIAIFDKFYVFDEDDVFQHNGQQTLLSHNFYFDFESHNPSSTKYDLYFLGFHNKGREQLLLQFYSVVKGLLDEVNFQIVFPLEQRCHKPTYQKVGITCLDHVIPFEQYLENIKSSRFIVDFLIGEHNGLSFRIFEGLKYKRKVITTNPNVIKYDFYNPNNFLILNENNSQCIDVIREFLETPYVAIPENIRNKYSFSSWIETILSDEN